jgi:hypothetical protein
MSERTEYANGEFCWVELISPEADTRSWEDEPGRRRCASLHTARGDPIHPPSSAYPRVVGAIPAGKPSAFALEPP